MPMPTDQSMLFIDNESDRISVYVDKNEKLTITELDDAGTLQQEYHMSLNEYAQHRESRETQRTHAEREQSKKQERPALSAGKDKSLPAKRSHS